jgi:hypothetical protein
VELGYELTKTTLQIYRYNDFSFRSPGRIATTFNFDQTPARRFTFNMLSVHSQGAAQTRNLKSMLTICYHPAIRSLKLLNLAVFVTPPQADSDRAKMSPVQFTISSPTRASIKRKASLPDITEENAKRFRLEPPANSSDTTIAEYQKRVNRDDGILMMIPFESTWTKMREEITNIREEVNAQEAKVIT